MKIFSKGIFGALLVLLAAAIIVPQYSGYRAAAETSSWLNEIAPTKDAISANVIRLKTTSGSGIGIPKPVIPHHAPSLMEVTDSGTIFLKGGRDGQFPLSRPVRCLGVALVARHAQRFHANMGPNNSLQETQNRYAV